MLFWPLFWPAKWNQSASLDPAKPVSQCRGYSVKADKVNQHLYLLRLQCCQQTPPMTSHNRRNSAASQPLTALDWNMMMSLHPWERGREGVWLRSLIAESLCGFQVVYPYISTFFTVWMVTKCTVAAVMAAHGKLCTCTIPCPRSRGYGWAGLEWSQIHLHCKAMLRLSEQMIN